jgi:hypothetical protein
MRHRISADDDGRSSRTMTSSTGKSQHIPQESLESVCFILFIVYPELSSRGKYRRKTALHRDQQSSSLHARPLLSTLQRMTRQAILVFPPAPCLSANNTLPTLPQERRENWEESLQCQYALLLAPSSPVASPFVNNKTLQLPCLQRAKRKMPTKPMDEENDENTISFSVR